jgi:hypothetical protein
VHVPVGVVAGQDFLLPVPKAEKVYIAKANHAVAGAAPVTVVGAPKQVVAGEASLNEGASAGTGDEL